MVKKELKEKRKKESGVVSVMAYEIRGLTEVIGSEVGVTVPSHMQRGSEPAPYDHVLQPTPLQALELQLMKLVAVPEQLYLWWQWRF